MTTRLRTDTYRGGMIFVSERTGAFFYIDPAIREPVRALMTENRFRPWDE